MYYHRCIIILFPPILLTIFLFLYDYLCYLIGHVDPDDGGVGQRQTEQLMERQNDKKLEELSNITGRLKLISGDIESAIAESNNLIDNLVCSM